MSRNLKMPPSESRRRGYRVAILGPQTAHCEKCQADCADELDSWVVLGLCATCATAKAGQQKVAGR